MKRSFAMSGARSSAAAAADVGARETRDRLLDVAEELFAAKGYAGTSVRDITARAGSNLAAVNYHFGSKHNLYREALLRRLGRIRRQRLVALEAASLRNHTEAGLAPVLTAFAETFLVTAREAPPEQRPALLLMRELIDPQLPPDMVETELVEPVQQALTTAMAAHAPRLPERTVQLAAQSFLAQLVHVLHARRLAPGVDDGDSETLDPSELVHHIVRFTIAALERLQESRS